MCFHWDVIVSLWFCIIYKVCFSLLYLSDICWALNTCDFLTTTLEGRPHPPLVFLVLSSFLCRKCSIVSTMDFPLYSGTILNFSILMKISFRILLLPISTKNRSEKEEDTFKSSIMYKNLNGTITKNKAKPFNYFTLLLESCSSANTYTGKASFHCTKTIVTMYF